MLVDSFFDISIFEAFKMLCKYEDKKILSLDQIKMFRKEILLSAQKDYREFQEYDKKAPIEELQFKKIDEDKALYNFLSKYSDYFYLEGDLICLKDNIGYYKLENYIINMRQNFSNEDRDFIDCYFYFEENDNIKNILNITKKEEELAKYSKIEEKLEKLYYKLYTKEDTEELRKKIRSLLFMRFNFHNYIRSLKEYQVDAYRMSTPDVEYKLDKYPINLELWGEDYEDPEDILADIDDRVYDITQYSIFGKEKDKLFIKKMHEDIESYYMTECNPFGNHEDEEDFDPNNDYSFDMDKMMDLEDDFNPDDNKRYVTLHDPTEEFYVLYINYLNNLNNYMKKYGKSEELLLTKKRLLYSLDKPEVMLFNENNFKKEVEKTKEAELDENPFHFFVDEIFFIAEESFKVPINEYTIRKLILVGTYYDLTKNKDLKELIEKYKDNPRYDFFYEVMINNCRNKATNNYPTELVEYVGKTGNVKFRYVDNNNSLNHQEQPKQLVKKPKKNNEGQQ